MPRNNKTSSVLRLVSNHNTPSETDSKDNKNGLKITVQKNNSNIIQSENNATPNQYNSEINNAEELTRKKSRRKTVVKNLSDKKLVGNHAPNPVIQNISGEQRNYYWQGNERQIVNVSALLISEQLCAALERFNSCCCDICCRSVTEKAMAVMPDCFIHVNTKSDEEQVNMAMKKYRTEAVKVLTKICIIARTNPFHD